MRVEDQVSAALEKAGPQLEKVLKEVVLDIPESQKKKSADPKETARGLAAEAARKAAAYSGALAIPQGPLGILTMVPDLVIVWRTQAQLVADVAAVYGQSDRLDKELMAYCLFKHVSADAVKDIVVRAGERVIVSPTTVIAFYRVLNMIVGQFLAVMAGRFMMRWLPILGIAGLAAYSFKDTKRVGETAIETFSAKIEKAPKRPARPLSARDEASGERPRRRKHGK